MGSNVSFSYDGRGVLPFDGLVREDRVPDADSRFDSQTASPIGLAQDDNLAVQ